MMPVAYLIRAGVDAQQQDYSDRPYLWARKIVIPLALTLIAVLLGSFSLYSKEQRLAIQKVHAFIEQGKQSQNIQTLPKPLQDVSGYLENARGSYTLDWSGGVDTFMGPRPAGSELSQFLVIARYENGFAFACVFSSNRTVPNCAVY
jgi:hypothetical protein